MVRLAADCIVAYGIYWHGFRTSIAWCMISTYKNWTRQRQHVLYDMRAYFELKHEARMNFLWRKKRDNSLMRILHSKYTFSFENAYDTNTESPHKHLHL